MTFSCEQCGASLACDGVRTATCPYCASPSFVERPASGHQISPAFVLPFGFDAAGARTRLDAWLGSRSVFVDRRVKRAAVEDLRGVYLPAYLYSAVARTAYTATIGEHYTETEEYETTDSQGNKKTETRAVTRTEYRPLAGKHVGYVTDVVVSASKGLPNAELAAIEPYDMRLLRIYDPAVITGWIAEEFSRDATECIATSRTEANDDIGRRLRRFMPGDSHSDLEWRTRVNWESLEPILLPIWVFAVSYREDKPPLRVVINGQTGRVAGKVPLSWWKVAIPITLFAIALGIFIYLNLRGQ
jgi:hypothetical protein